MCNEIVSKSRLRAYVAISLKGIYSEIGPLAFSRMEEWSAVDETSKNKSGLWLIHARTLEKSEKDSFIVKKAT